MPRVAPATAPAEETRPIASRRWQGRQVALSPAIIALLALAAFFASVIDAIAGGGGLITLPALLAAGLPPHYALGTNKGAAVFGSGTALVVFSRQGRVSGDRARITLPLGFLGSMLGAALVLAVPPTILRPLILCLLPLVAIALLTKKPEAHIAPMPRARLLRRAALIALGIGAYDGFFGPGTGTFVIAASLLLLGEPLLDASANAKVVNFASNLAAMLLFASRGNILWQVALPMALGTLSGGFVGAHIAMRGGARVIRVAVVLVVCALTTKLGYELFSS